MVDIIEGRPLPSMGASGMQLIHALHAAPVMGFVVAVMVVHSYLQACLHLCGWPQWRSPGHFVRGDPRDAFKRFPSKAMHQALSIQSLWALSIQSNASGALRGVRNSCPAGGWQRLRSPGRFVRRNQRDAQALGAGARRAAGAVDVGVRRSGQLVVHHTPVHSSPKCSMHMRRCIRVGGGHCTYRGGAVRTG